MTAGLSGSFAINGTNFTLQPSSFRWMQRENYGFDGNGHAIYDSHRNAELQWDLISMSDYSQIINGYNLTQNTGTLSFDLPEYGRSDYRFKTYSGTTIEETDAGEFFMQYVMSVRLVIHLVRT